MLYENIFGIYYFYIFFTSYYRKMNNCLFNFKAMVNNALHKAVFLAIQKLKENKNVKNY